MNSLSHIQPNPHANQVAAPAEARRPQPREHVRDAYATADADRVELSEQARTRPDGPVRRELVDQVKREISAGTYLTRDKLNAAIDRFVGELRSQRTAPISQAG